MKDWWFQGYVRLDLLNHNRVFLSGLTRINPTALLIAHVLLGDFRYDYCGSIPLSTALGINIQVFGAEAVLF